MECFVTAGLVQPGKQINYKDLHLVLPPFFIYFCSVLLVHTALYRSMFCSLFCILDMCDNVVDKKI